MGNSIVATFGGDTGPLKTAFNKAAAMAKESAREQATAYNQITKAQEEQLKLEKLRATAAGNHAAAESIQEEIDLRSESLRLTKELGIAEHEAIAIAKERLALNRQIAASESGGKKGPHGGGLNGGNLARIAGDTINQATGTSGAVSLINTLRHIPGPLLAIIAPIIAVGVGLKKLHASITAVDELNQEARRESFKNVSNQVIAGPESAGAAAQEKTKQIDKLAASSNGYFSAAKSFLADKIFNFNGAGVRSSIGGFDISTEGNAQEKSVALQDGLEKQRADVLIESTKRVKEEVKEREKLATGSEFDLAILNEKKATEEKIARIRDSAGPGASNTSALVAKEQSASDVRIKQLLAAKNIKEQELAIEAELTRIHTGGAEEEISSARERLNAALTELQATRDLSLETQKAAENKVAAAATELVLTQRRRAEQVAQIALQKQLADQIAPESEKQDAELAGRRRILEESLRTARPDERSQIEADLAGVGAEERAKARAKLERGRHIEDSGVEGNTGFGDAEHLAALSERIRLGRKRIDQDEKAGTVEEDQLAANRAQLAVLIKERDHLVLIKGREVDYAKEGNKVLEAEIGRHFVLAERLRTELSFAEQINQARDNGDSARVRELQQAKELTLQKQAQAVAVAKADRTRLSLSELAKNGEGKTGAIARRIVRLEKRAGEEAGRGNQQAAQKYQSRADALRNSLAALKEGEKPREGAVDAPAPQKGSRETDFKGTFKKRTPEEIAESRRRQVGPSDFNKLFPKPVKPGPTMADKLKYSFGPIGRAGQLGGTIAEIMPILIKIADNTGRFVIKNK